MTRVLVTGGAGGFGRALVPRLISRGYTVRILSRQPAPAGVTTEWSQADIASGAGLAAALAGVDVIVHAASSPAKHTRQIDVEGTRRLLQAARAAEVAHIAYISIVGIDQIPLAYYRHKLVAEALVSDSRLPWSILRATQFHTLIDGLLQVANRLPLVLLPTDLRYQPIDVGEAAERMAEVVATGPAVLPTSAAQRC
ncbi:MAG: NAD(P)H-binding protein [Roseiflexaceae bacterium]